MRLLWLGVALLTAFFAGTWIFVNLTGYSGTQVEERTLRVIASMAASSLDSSSIGQLTGTTGDYGSPAFVRTRAELKKIRQAVPRARFVYLMGKRRDGEVIFLVDAEDAGSPDYSPPGQTYPEASPALMAVLSGGSPFVEEAYRDRWGEWVSGLAAVRNRPTGRVVAVLGIDIPAESWRGRIGSYRIYGVAIAGMIATLMAMVQFVHWPERRLF